MIIVGKSVKKKMTTLGMTAVMLALILAPVADAQSPVETAPPMMDNSVTSPTMPPGMDSSSPLGQVVRLLQSGVAENTILADIAHSTAPFNLNAAALVYVNDLGMPDVVVTAMVQRDHDFAVTNTAAQLPPPDPSQPPQDVTEDYFYGALAPYGTWVNLPGYGLCWQPWAALYDPGWTPYGTSGQWVYTDCGWYWLSGYSWGWCVFHYGRWFHDAQWGWCWWPATTWAPSWVFWRYAGNDCGWAPLPPHCYYSQGNGLIYNGAPVAPGYDFGMGENLFNFVPMANLGDGNLERYRLAAAPAAQVFARSQIVLGINSNERTIVNDGIPLNHLYSATRKVMWAVTLQAVPAVAVPGSRGEAILADGKTLAISRPYFNGGSSSSLRAGVSPTADQQQPAVHQPPSIIVNENPATFPAYDNGNDNNNVIYVDAAAQNGPPVPTVTTAGPQDVSGNVPGAGASGPGLSYWSVSAEPPAAVDSASVYMSPRMREHVPHHVSPSDNHREFNPPANGAGSAEHSQPHAPPHDEGNAHDSHTEPREPHPAAPSSPSGAAPHNTPSGPPSGQGHGR